MSHIAERTVDPYAHFSALFGDATTTAMLLQPQKGHAPFNHIV